MRLKILGLALVLLALSVSEAQASTARLTARSHPQEWVSAQRWGPTASVLVQPFVNGKEVPGIGGNGTCHINFVGHGIVVRSNVCGASAVPIRLHYQSLGGKPIRFSVRYETLR